MIWLWQNLNLLPSTENSPFVVLYFSFSSYVKVSTSNRPSEHSQFFITGVLSSSLISYALVSSIFITSSWKFNSFTYLSGTSQLNLGLSSTSSLFLCPIFMLVWCCGQPDSFISVSDHHHDCCGCLHSSWFTISFMLSESAISNCMSYACSAVAFICLHLPT